MTGQKSIQAYFCKPDPVTLREEIFSFGFTAGGLFCLYVHETPAGHTT